MIITVTLNPAVDKTITIDRMVHGGLNRIQQVEMDAGGKGINVSKAIHALGGKSIAIGFIAGNTGEFIRNDLHQLGISTDFVQIKGETRTNTKVCEPDGIVTEFNEAGAQVTPAQLQQLLHKISEYATSDSLFVLSGSAPKGVPADIYAQITTLVHGKGGRVLVDAEGALFAHALQAVPDLLKPNRMELEQYENLANATPKQLLSSAQKLISVGVQQVAVSLGAEGALFASKDKQVLCPGLPVSACSTVGAGDAMVAALAFAWDCGMPFHDTCTLAMATATGAVTTTGTKPPARAVVDALQAQVVLQPLS